MNKNNIGFGVFLLTVGILWALMNMGVIDWSVFDSIFTLWPLIFVVIGINIIFRQSTAVRIASWLIFLAVIIGYGNFYDGGVHLGDYRNGSGQKAENVTIEKLTETKYGKASFGLGGTTFDLDSDTGNLLEASITDPNVKYRSSYENGNETAVIKFDRKNNFRFGEFRHDYSSNFHLNENVVWDLDVDTGAVQGTFDMTKLKVQKVDLDMGAGKLMLKFGDNYERTNVKIDAGASKIDLVIPRTVGVSVKMDGGLNSTNLSSLGWEKTDGYYRSPNYKDQGINKIDIDVDMGVGKFDIEW